MHLTLGAAGATGLLLLLGATGVPAAVAAPDHRTQSDPVGDQQRGAAWSGHRAVHGETDLRRSTFTVAGGRLVVRYGLGDVRAPSRRYLLEVSTGAVLDNARGGDEFDLTLDVTAHPGATLFVDRTPTCGRTVRLAVRPAQDRLVVTIPLHCLPAGSTLGDVSTTDHVYVRAGLATVGRDHTGRAHWGLPLS